MPTLESRLKTTTAIIASIQECKCGTRIDVSRFQAFQELTCPGCAGNFIVQGQPCASRPQAVGPTARVGSGAIVDRLAGKWKAIASTTALLLVAVIAFNMVRKSRARDAVSPIPQMPSAALAAAKAAPALNSLTPATGVSAGRAHAAIAGGVYKLKNRETNQVVDVSAWNSNNDAKIQTWSSGGGLNQRWIIRPAGGGFQLIALHSCKALEVLGGSKDDAAAIRQGALSGADHQIWNFEPVSDGFHRIVAKCSGKVLTVLDVNAKSGALLGQRAAAGSRAQEWKLEPLGGWPSELNPILEGRPLGGAPAAVRATKAAQPVGSTFVPISLAGVANCDSRAGSFSRPESLQDTLHPLLTGWVQAGGVTFDVIDVATAATGKDLLILRGGMGPPKTAYPKKVEVPVNGAPLTKLHFLGGVGGWGYPWDKTDKHVGVLAAQVTVVRKGGAQQVLQFRNGIEFADYHVKVDVPGSAFVEGFADYSRQARFFTKTLAGSEPVEKLIIESFETNIAPIFVAITGEVAR